MPTQLAWPLVHGYCRIDPDQVLPTVRRNIEQLIGLIARGEASFDVVVPLASMATRCDFGTLVLDRNSAPKWRVDCNCNACLYRIELPERAHRVHVSKATCGACGSFKLAIDFHAKLSPLADGESKYVGCVMCDALLTEVTTDARAWAPSAGGRRAWTKRWWKWKTKT